MVQKKKLYQSKATTTSISATSRVAIKIRDNFYTVESHEERSVPPDANIDKEWEFLWNSINTVTDMQAQDIINTFTKK